MSPLYQLDERVFRFIHVDMHQLWLDPVMRAITDTGRGEVKFTVLVALWFVYRYRRYMLMVLAAGVTSGIFAQVLKLLVTRERPGNLEFAHPLPSYIEALSGQAAPIASNSFPSGHATSCFGIAVAVAWACRGGDRAWVGWAVIGWATVVSFSRVYLGVHYLSDVVAGAALGAVFGTLAWMVWRKNGWVPLPGK
ncbi:MAG: phosphatase PAP2 family protein [Armatimonadetes bacterium]|nr:phosphatase PAP2 family protein [Armatimonadota bacterium]